MAGRQSRSGMAHARATLDLRESPQRTDIRRWTRVPRTRSPTATGARGRGTRQFQPPKPGSGTAWASVERSHTDLHARFARCATGSLRSRRAHGHARRRFAELGCPRLARAGAVTNDEIGLRPMDGHGWLKGMHAVHGGLASPALGTGPRSLRSAKRFALLRGCLSQCARPAAESAGRRRGSEPRGPTARGAETRGRRRGELRRAADGAGS